MQEKRSPHSPKEGHGLTTNVRMAVNGAEAESGEDAHAWVLLETVCPSTTAADRPELLKILPTETNLPKLQGLASSMTSGPLTYVICFLIPTYLGTDTIIFLFLFKCSFLSFFNIVFIFFIYC